MPFELVIYLCVGILLMVVMCGYEWFWEDRLTGPTIGLGLLMVLCWPLGLLGLTGCLIGAICDDNFVIKRRRNK
uniref:Membrane protein n=1 Tax=Salmonella phage vB_SEnST11_KE23 TaxID=3161174 RepID=A0AAU8GFP8_9CAUD